MSVKDAFEKLSAALESVGIPYFVTGSFESERWVAVLELDAQWQAARDRAGS